MARYRRMNMSVRPVQRIKHVVDDSATVAGGATNVSELVLASDTPVIANTTNVITGAKVNGIYLRVNVASNEAQDVGAIPNVYMAVFKNLGNNLTGFPAPNAVGASDKKKFFIHQEMGMLDNKLGGQPTTLFNGVIVIPKGMRRFGPEDRLAVMVLSPALNIAVCVQCHYKEFR